MTTKEKAPVAIDLKNQARNNSLQKNMFNFLSSKKINVKLIDLNPIAKDEVDHLENLIVQGKHIDRNGNEFYFQLHLDKERLKLDTAQPQVTIYFQHLKESTIQQDVDTNGQMYSSIVQYLYSKENSKFTIYKSKKEEATENA